MTRSERRIPPSPHLPIPPSPHLPITIVGIGDDGPAGLGERAREAISGAELLVGGRRHLAFYEEHPAEKLAITDNVEEIAARLAAESAHRRCVVLSSGDPCFFGVGPLLAEWLGRDRVEIIPHVSSVALAFARLGLAWQDTTVLSAHGRPLRPLLERALAAPKLAFLTDENNSPATIASALLAAGKPDCQAFVLEHLGGADERLVETRLSQLPGQTFANLNVLVLLEDAQPPPASVGAAVLRHGQVHDPDVQTGEMLLGRRLHAVFGRSEDEFRHSRGQITKSEVRAVALAKLQLPTDGVLWDVGAGSGSLAIEAAGLMPRGMIYAVERNAEQLDCLRENVCRHRADRVRPVAGEAPDALRELPPPDRVFVGGGGKALGAIIRVCLARLGQGGRLVANTATLESALEAHDAVRTAGWRSELVQIGVARGRAAAGRTRLEALNPVFIVSTWPDAPRRCDGETQRRGDAETRRGEAQGA
jgi:precorrin-6Y C5,15-methyltransferase (decarboxylating)